MRPQVALALLLLLAGLVSPARALVLLGGTGTQQFTDPGAGLPWANVGNVGGGSGVYLGDFGGSYWVLTASHLVGSVSSLGNLVIDSGTYAYVPGSGVVVRNGDNSPTDLTLFRISTDPGLANLSLAISAPAVSSIVKLVGRGLIEGSANYWAVTVNPGTSDDVWVIQGGNPAGANAAGYLEAGGAAGAGDRTPSPRFPATMWARATPSPSTPLSKTPCGSTQAAGGDSGGATFYYTGTSWELAGILGAVAGFENQPASTAVLGDATFSSSIATYRSFIVDAAIPEPATVTLGLGVVALVPRRLSAEKSAVADRALAR